MYFRARVFNRGPSRSAVAGRCVLRQALRLTVFLVLSSLASVRGAERLGPSSRRSGLVITEVMYASPPAHPNRNLEFVELYNASAIAEDLSGFRITGEWSYLFPPNTLLQAGSFLVVAGTPGDVAAVYGMTSAIGGIAQRLPDDSGTLRLLNRSGAKLLELDYQARYPWPVAAGGGGCSMVLSTPSLGEKNPRAWSASRFIGGSPGRDEPAAPDPRRGLWINEAALQAPRADDRYVEFWNRTKQPVEVSGCWIVSGESSPALQIPLQPALPAGAFRTLTGLPRTFTPHLLRLENPERTQVIQAIRYQPVPSQAALGRYPDGTEFLETLEAPSPGLPNLPPHLEDVLINELMYHPLSGDPADEYLELLNRGSHTVALSGWHLEGTIRFAFPTDAKILAGDVLVIAKNRERILGSYPGLAKDRVIGNYAGTLRQGHPGVRLLRPEIVIVSDTEGSRTTAPLEITVDEIEWGQGGRWGEWADGGGSSLELIDPRSDNRRAANWADSDETGKAGWSLFEHTGTLDHGVTLYDELQVLLVGKGECLIDDLHVSKSGGPNLILNAGFESSAAGWTAGGNHRLSSWHSEEGASGSKAYRVHSSGGGDNGANCVETDLGSPLANGNVGTIRVRARWRRGSPQLLLRLHGNPLELSAKLSVPKNLGSPGRPNSRFRSNVGPAIGEVSHAPEVPGNMEPLTITALIEDTDGLSSPPLLRYRIDPGSQWRTLTMRDDGQGEDDLAADGNFAARLPGQASGTVVAFYIEAIDAFAAPAATTFPDGAPQRECVVRFGDPPSTNQFGVYRFWITDSTRRAWETRPPLSNEFLEGTLIYADSRIVYNTGARYHGSPYSRPGYTGPTKALCAFNLETPKDDLILGVDELYLDPPALYSNDLTLQREELAFHLANRFDLPFSHKRYVNFWVNGVARGVICAETQQPNSDYVEAWFPDDDRGELFKIDDWFEFNDVGLFESWNNATLEPFLTVGGAKKQARYRWNWEKKANHGLNDNYAALFRLVDALNERDPELYTARVEALVDVEQWMRAFSIRHLTEDSDGYGHGRGKNMFAYKPANGRWQMLVIDLDHGFGTYNTSSSDSLFSVNDPTIGRMYNHPPFRRAYLRALKEAILGPFSAAEMETRMKAMESVLVKNGIPVGPLAPVKTWTDARRSFIRISVAAEDTPQFRVTAPAGGSYTTNRNLVVLSGTAPVEIKTIQVNGHSYPTRWMTPIAWQTKVPLQTGPNHLSVGGLDRWGQPVMQNELTLDVLLTSTNDPPEGAVVINEINYHPAVSGTEFLEIFNVSTTTTFDLSDWRVNGVGFTFPSGTLLAPNAFVVVASQPGVLASQEDKFMPLAGRFPGTLDPEGETLQLIQQTANTPASRVVDQVTYRNTRPWPLAAAGSGASLQLIDASSDNDHPRNWFAAAPAASTNRITYLGFTNAWRFDQTGRDLETQWRSTSYDDSAWPSGAGLFFVENAVLPASKRTALRLGPTTYYFRAHFTNELPYGAGGTLQLYTIVDDGAVFSLNGTEVFRTGMPEGEVTSGTFASRNVNDAALEGPFEISAAGLMTGRNLLTAEVHQLNPFSADVVFGATLQSGSTNGAPSTPGRPNAVRLKLPLSRRVFINEWMASNTRFLRDPSTGLFSDWFELYNPDEASIDLTGWRLTDDWAEPQKFILPPRTAIDGGGFLLIWADDRSSLNQISQTLHANFKLSQTGELLALFMPDGTLSDSVTFSGQAENESEGRSPDGHASPYVRLKDPTPQRHNPGGAEPGLSPRIIGITVASGKLVIEWTSVTGQTYQVQYQDQLTNPVWLAGSELVTATFDVTRIPLPISGAAQRFYRIALLRP